MQFLKLLGQGQEYVGLQLLKSHLQSNLPEVDDSLTQPYAYAAAIQQPDGRHAPYLMRDTRGSWGQQEGVLQLHSLCRRVELLAMVCVSA